MNPDDQYVPCQWLCHTCGFQLSKNFLNPESGAVGGDNRDHFEQCPNDGERMERLTWKAHAEGLEKGIMLQVQRAVKAEAWKAWVLEHKDILLIAYWPIQLEKFFKEADKEVEKVSLT